MLTVEKITSYEQFEQLEPKWNSLLAESASNNISLTSEWLTTWWSIFGKDRELLILLVRDNKQLVAIAPLLARQVQHYNLLPYKRLEFLASGEDEADEICSSYLDFIIRRGREAEGLKAILDYLRKQEPDWDEIVLTDVPKESPNLSLLKELCDSCGIKMGITRSQSCVYVPLPDSFEALLATLGPRTRKRIRRDRKAIASNGVLRIIERPEEFEENFEILIHLHQARWTSRGKPGVFASTKFTQFHRALAPRLLNKGWLKLFVLLVDGEPISASYVFTYNGKACDYQGGFIKCEQVQSPGMVLESFAIEKAIEAGLSEYDLLKGAPSSYKFRWSKQTREVVQLRLAQSKAKETLYGATTKLTTALRALKRSIVQQGEL
jgi:CelD/BcsL family acetyltransferase involved in cellulose biosynthesis